MRKIVLGTMMIIIMNMIVIIKLLIVLSAILKIYTKSGHLRRFGEGRGTLRKHFATYS